MKTTLTTSKIKTLLSPDSSNPHAFFKDLFATYKTTYTSNLEKIKSSFLSTNNSKLKTLIHQMGANGNNSIRLSKRFSSYHNTDHLTFEPYLLQKISNEYSNSKSELLAHLNSLQIHNH